MKFSLLQGAYWAVSCVQFFFLVPLFREMGYSIFEIGLLNMLIAGSNMVAQPFWGMFCDRKGHIRTVFISQMLAGCFLVYFLPLSGDRILIAAIVVIGLTVSVQSMSSIIDAWSVKLMHEGDFVDYGWTRSIGSLFFASAAITFGFLLDHYGDWIRIPVITGLTILVVLIAFGIRNPSQASRSPTPGQTESKEIMLALWHNRRFVRFICCSFLVRLGSCVSLIFYPLLINELGGSNADLGVGLFIMAISEVPIMMLFGFFASRVAKVPVLLAIGMFFFGIKTALIAISPNVVWAIGVQVLEALSYGLFFPAAIYYVSDSVDRRSLVTSQMVLSSVFNGLCLLIGSLLGGLLSEKYGVGEMMLTMSSLSFLGLLLFLLLASPKMKRADGLSKEDRKCPEQS